ncbi:Fc.00g060700.m01.CDS01 [Cosmosporella sp. VM-42]
MARTRSTKAAPAKSKASAESKAVSTKYVLPPKPENPSKLFILPSRATPDARIVTLPNPRNTRPSRYLVCPETGIYEFTKVAAPKTTPRSWLIETASDKETIQEKDGGEVKAQVSMGAEIYLATTIDPLFLLLPALADLKASKGSGEQKRLFLSSDDHFDKLPEESSHLSEILRCDKSRKLMEARMGAICDIVEAGDESMFRLSEKKLLAVVLNKAKRMSEHGLPPSMEDKFVTKALEAPILIQKREINTTNGVPITDSEESTQAESNDSQLTVASTDTAVSSFLQPSTAATSFSEEPAVPDKFVRAIEATPEIIKLQRLRVAFNFICGSYIAPALTTQLERLLANIETSSLDFSPLDEYLVKLTKLRVEAVSARSAGDYSRKHTRDEEQDEARAEKRRKMEEEKKKKATASRGVKNLKKVDTTGMKKMSDFFKKK